MPCTTAQWRKAQPRRRFLHSPAKPQFPRNPLTHFPDTARPSSRQPKLDWVITLPLAGDFLRHLSTGITSSGSLTLLFLPRGARLDSEPARSIHLSAELIILLAVHVWLIDPLHRYRLSKELKNISCNARSFSLSQSCAAPLRTCPGIVSGRILSITPSYANRLCPASKLPG